ncbi:unnamed protein product [Boreogadus saida]
MKSFLRNPIQDGRERDNHVFNAEGCPGGDSPTALGVTPRKRLHSAEDARCSSRPAPEGAGSVPLSESETGRRGEEKGGLCGGILPVVYELNLGPGLGTRCRFQAVEGRSRPVMGKS